MVDILRDAVGQKKPLSFFGLEGKQGNNGGYSVSNSKDFFVIVAKGARAKAIEDSAEQLRSTPDSEREVLEQGFQPNHVNYDDVAGTEVFCQSLNRVAKATGIKSIDEGATVWQLNWVEVGWPQGEEADVWTKGGERLWFLVRLMDASGSAPEVRMNETSSLCLAGVDSKEK